MKPGNRGGSLAAGPGRASLVRIIAGIPELDISQQEIPGRNLSTPSLLKLFIYLF